MPVIENKKEEMCSVRLELEIAINASIEKVWHAIVNDTSLWWPKDFHTSPNTKAFKIEPKLGGRMYEEEGNGNGLIWMTVQGIRPPKYLFLVGQISPPFGGPATSLLTIQLDSKSDKETVLKLQDNCFGQLGGNMQKSLDDGWNLLFGTHLKEFIEK